MKDREGVHVHSQKPNLEGKPNSYISVVGAKNKGREGNHGNSYHSNEQRKIGTYLNTSVSFSLNEMLSSCFSVFLGR
jgi:hypothetical protein